MAERIIVQISDDSKLNSALKIWKKKSRYITEELRKRKEFKKPSVKEREKISKAVYREKFNRED
jgi:ribosomal protein S21